MPRRRKQHWNDWNPGFQRNSRQNPYNSHQSFQRNMGQTFHNSHSNQANFIPDAGYYYDNSDFQSNYTQNYSNNYYDPSYQRNFPQNHSQSSFSQNYQTNFTQHSRNTDYNPNFQRNVPVNRVDLNVNSNINNPNFQRNVPVNRLDLNVNSNINNPNFQRNVPRNRVDLNVNSNINNPNFHWNVPVNRLDLNVNSNINNPNFQQNVPVHRFDLNVNSNINNSNFQRNVPRNGNNDLIVKSKINTIVQRDIEQQHQSYISQNESTKNIIENPKNNPWYKKTQPIPPKEGRKKKPKGDFLDKYNRKTESFNEKGYIIKETLYQDPSLFYANNNNNDDSPSDDETNDNNWTDTFWQKHDDTADAVPKHSRMSQSTKTVSRKNQNTLERSLNDMLAKPVEMSKGKSLLLKMGWQGGGLGRDEDGIVEPIAPKATYAVKTIGLGHLTEKPKKPTKPFANISNKKLKHPEFQNHFCTNVLLYILEFVKNDEENKIVFEPRLRKLERKRIHQIVEKIRVSNNLDDFENFENFSDRHLELVEQIWVHNCYELWTESEGEKQHRRICLFKEAPAHVYLVTPEDLTENDEKNGDIDDKNGDSDININIKEEKDSENIVSDKQNDMIGNNTENIHDTEKDKDNTMNRENCKTDQENDKLNSKDRKIDSLQDVKKEISEMTDSQMAVDINVDENNQTPASNTLEMTQKVKDSDFCCETIPNMETNEVIENDHENDKCNSEDSKIDTSLHIKKNIPELIDSQMAADININDNNQILVSNDNNTLELTQKVKDSKFCSEITPNMKISDDVIKKDLENDKFISEDTKIDKLEDIRKEISESTYSQIAMNINMDKHHQILVKNDHNTLEMSQKIEDSDFCIEIIPNMEISDVIIISSDESDSESTEMATNNDLSHEIKPNNDRNVEIIEENQQISVQNENKISEEVADINICNDIKFELKINEEYKKIDEKMPAKATNIKPKIENGGQNFNDYLNTDLVLFNEIENLSTGKRSILSKIVEYFKEFSSDETFKEFRFLGPFNSEQIMHINVFFNICMKQDNIEYCYEKHELLTTFDNGLVKFDVLEDNNGKRFIQKVEENPRVTI